MIAEILYRVERERRFRGLCVLGVTVLLGLATLFVTFLGGEQREPFLLSTVGTPWERVCPLARLTVDELHVLSQTVREEAAKHKIDERLVMAVVAAESRCRFSAVSSKGARGPMQVMPVTAREMGVRDLTCPRQNIAAGVQYLSRLLKKFDGNRSLALAAYNSGPRNVERAGGRVPKFKETQNYVRKVTLLYNQLRAANVSISTHDMA